MKLTGALILSLLFAFASAERTFANPITVLNAGFENATLPFNFGNGPFNQVFASSTQVAPGGTLSDWVASSTTTSAAAGAFAPVLNGNNWSSTWWSGSNVGYVQVGAAGTASLSETLVATLNSDTVYTLSALIGRRGFTPAFNYALQLYAGSTLLASASNLALSPNSFGLDTATYVSGSSNPLAGQTLRVVLQSTFTNGVQTEAFFDNVSLDGSAVPEPATIAMGAMGLGAILLYRRRRTC